MCEIKVLEGSSEGQEGQSLSNIMPWLTHGPSLCDPHIASSWDVSVAQPPLSIRTPVLLHPRPH